MITTVRDYAQLFRWHQPIGIWLLLWPVLISLWVASHGQPRIEHILLFVLGSIASRSAGCVVNDWCDRDIDGQVTRTQARPLASGRLRGKQAIPAFVLLLLICAAIVVFFGGHILLLGIVAALCLSLYPLSKRYVRHPQLVLSVTYSLGIPMAWVAGGRDLFDGGWIVLYLANLVWVYGYDTIYAMADKPDDEYLFIHSSALTWGRYDALVTALCFVTVVLLLALWMLMQSLAWTAFVALPVLILGFIWQIHYIRHRSITRCITAFRSNHKLQLLLLLAIVGSYVIG